MMVTLQNFFQLIAFTALIIFILSTSQFAFASATYPIVDTGQTDCYGNSGVINCPSTGSAYNGQDAQYSGNQPRYSDNGDGTITDQVTGLMWQQGFTRVEWADAQTDATAATTGGYTDWRVPTNKELYSLINFNGHQGTGNPSSSTPPADAVPFIDTGYFDFEYPTDSRYIDAQYVTNTVYTSTVSLDGITEQDVFFGVNLADGRIKGYPQSGSASNREFYARYVRGNTQYGINSFTNNGDGTISDNATGLLWMRVDSGHNSVESSLNGYTYSDGSLDWGEALDFCENLVYAGSSNWRLPDAKELHSIVDYTRSPDYTNSAAIDSVFSTTAITNEAGSRDYPGFWASTSFKPGRDGIVIYFGEALGYMNNMFLDVHGAGAQRTDAKEGSPSWGSGPQGDVRRVYNYVRCVQDDIDSYEPPTAVGGFNPAIFSLLLKNKD